MWPERNLQVSEKHTASIIMVEDGSLFYHHKDGSGMFFRTLEKFIADCKILCPGIQYSLNMRSENLKFYRLGGADYNKLYIFED